MVKRVDSKQQIAQLQVNAVKGITRKTQKVTSLMLRCSVLAYSYLIRVIK